jgi:hypothetical protein
MTEETKLNVVLRNNSTTTAATTTDPIIITEQVKQMVRLAIIARKAKKY